MTQGVSNGPRLVPAAGEAGPVVDRGGTALALRLAIGRDGLGIELARPATLGPIELVDLVIRLPQVRFPFDVTGGVAKFRHRRGVLERVAVELDARRLARWAEPQLRGLLGTAVCTVSIAPRPWGATVSILAGERALAFELAIVGGPDLVVVVHTARGVGLPSPATLLALQATARLAGDHAQREGARFVVTRAAEKIARVVLPDAGVRAPAGADIGLASVGEADGVLVLSFAAPAKAENVTARAEDVGPRAATLANELALLVRDGDDARFAGDLERARRLDLAALERAPRHAQIARRMAELDAHVGARAEAALAVLRGADRAASVGDLVGALLLEVGDRAGAVAAYLHEGEREPSAAVSALLHAQAARLASDPADALRWLDVAVSRAPALADLRWERAERRLAAGRLHDARADFQELEALAVGPAARFDVLRRAADIHRLRGLGSDAVVLYERALLYRPEEPATVAGLALAIAAEGRQARGATLLAQAITRAEKELLPTAWMELALGQLLGDLGDRPAGIARLRLVDDLLPEAIAARGLEGRYRAALGDAAGASFAFARLRERAGVDPAARPWLEEAATFEEARGEHALAQAHLAAALAIGADASLEARYRAVGEHIGRAAGLVVPVSTERPIVEEAPPVPAAPEELSPEEDEMRVEALTRTLQGDPTNDTVVDELVARLTRLGRGLELLALLSARLEDAPAERRAELLPHHLGVLQRLEDEARADGREMEADLFKLARESAG